MYYIIKNILIKVTILFKIHQNTLQKSKKKAKQTQTPQPNNNS